MSNENVKERLTGATVLVALAVIFLPSLFDKDVPAVVDTASQIPPSLKIEPVVVPKPHKLKDVVVTSPGETLFQPVVSDKPETNDHKLSQPAAESTVKEAKATNTNTTANIAKTNVAKANVEKTKAVAARKTATSAKMDKAELISSKVAQPGLNLGKGSVDNKVDKLQHEPVGPQFNQAGVPIGWVVQAASFKSQKNAEALLGKLQASNYKAYVESIKTAKGIFFRVFAGPYIDPKRAQEVKRAVDKQYRFSATIKRFNPASGQ